MGASVDPFLAASAVIDWTAPDVLALARELAQGALHVTDIAARCFHWVRDEVRHSQDFAVAEVTCSASEVLRLRAGFCYAKSHLLAALLRANRIPAALCYQRLELDRSRGLFCLHGLNAVLLPEFGWYRIDARGNNPGVRTEFCPPLEVLAFKPKEPGEWDLPGKYPEPLPNVVEVLTRFQTTVGVSENLPDLAPPAVQAGER